MQLSDYSQAEEVALLAKHGAEVSVAQEDGRQPIHIMAMWHHINALEALVEQKADVNARDGKGKTPMQLVCTSKKFEQTTTEEASVLSFVFSF